jgi:hypothetical protein
MGRRRSAERSVERIRSGEGPQGKQIVAYGIHERVSFVGTLAAKAHCKSGIAHLDEPADELY